MGAFIIIQTNEFASTSRLSPTSITIELHPQSAARPDSETVGCFQGKSTPGDIQCDLADMGCAAVFKEEDTLPSSEDHVAFGDRDDFACAGECHADVGGHVVGALESVAVTVGVFGDQALEEFFQITRRGGVCVFKNDEARACVANEHRHHAFLNGCVLEAFPDLGRDFVEALSMSWDIKKEGLRFHVAKHTGVTGFGKCLCKGRRFF